MAEVKRCVLANQVDDGHSGSIRVVKVREPIGQSWSQVEQGTSWLLSDASVSISSARYHAFEQSQHGAHPVNAVESCNEMNLGRSGIGKTNLNATSEESANQTFSAIHYLQTRYVGDEAVQSRHKPAQKQTRIKGWAKELPLESEDMHGNRRPRVLLVVENCPFVRDPRVKREGGTLHSAGYQVSVISPATSGTWYSRQYMNDVVF